MLSVTILEILSMAYIVRKTVKGCKTIKQFHNRHKVLNDDVSNAEEYDEYLEYDNY